MGCDIHMYPEVKRDGKWCDLYKFEPDQHAAQPWAADRNNYYGYDGRNYSLFGMLAGVRRPEMNVIAERRGLPLDASPIVVSEIGGGENDYGDFHSHSWLTLKEILDFDWSQTATLERTVDAKAFEAWRGVGPPKGVYCGGVSGANSVTLLPSEYLALRAANALHAGRNYNVTIEWQETYRDLAGDFLETTVERLKTLDPNPENVRIVFAFDN